MGCVSSELSAIFFPRRENLHINDREPLWNSRFWTSFHLQARIYSPHPILIMLSEQHHSLKCVTQTTNVSRASRNCLNVQICFPRSANAENSKHMQKKYGKSQNTLLSTVFVFRVCKSKCLCCVFFKFQLQILLLFQLDYACMQWHIL